MSVCKSSAGWLAAERALERAWMLAAACRQGQQGSAMHEYELIGGVRAFHPSIYCIDLIVIIILVLFAWLVHSDRLVSKHGHLRQDITIE